MLRANEQGNNDHDDDHDDHDDDHDDHDDDHDHHDHDDDDEQRKAARARSNYERTTTTFCSADCAYHIDSPENERTRMGCGSALFGGCTAITIPGTPAFSGPSRAASL